MQLPQREPEEHGNSCHLLRSVGSDDLILTDTAMLFYADIYILPLLLSESATVTIHRVFIRQMGRVSYCLCGIRDVGNSLTKINTQTAP